MSTATNPTLATWTELLSAVEQNSGVIKVPMATLRQLEGRQRVGKHILNAIEEKLGTLGLGHLPQELPNRQQQFVILYRSGTPAAELIEAVRQGATEPVSDTTYEHLYRFNSVPDPDMVVSRREAAEALEQTARNVLELLGKVRPVEPATPASKKTAQKVDLLELVSELSPTPTAAPEDNRSTADAS